MKIEVNLSGIFVDEDGNEIADSVKAEILEMVADRVFSSIKEKAERTVQDALESGVKQKVNDTLSSMIPELLDQEYVPKTDWGKPSVTTTLRARILEVFEKGLSYRKESYSSDKNAFTIAVDDVYGKLQKEFQGKFNNLVSDLFTKECFDYAQKKLQEKLGVKV